MDRIRGRLERGYARKFEGVAVVETLSKMVCFAGWWQEGLRSECKAAGKVRGHNTTGRRASERALLDV